jgi:hypothetical protein
MPGRGVSISEACRQLKVSEKELRAMMHDGRLRYRRVSGVPGKPAHEVIRASDIEALQPPKPAAPALDSHTLRNSRMVGLVNGVKAYRRRWEFLRSWTGEDHCPPVPNEDPAKLRQCPWQALRRPHDE